MCNFLQYVYVAPINKAQVTNWYKNSIIPLEYISIVYPCTLQSPSVTSSGLVSLEAKLVHASHCLDCTLYGCGLLQILSCSMPPPPIFPPSLLYMFILVLSVCCFRAIGRTHGVWDRGKGCGVILRVTETRETSVRRDARCGSKA